MRTRTLAEAELEVQLAKTFRREPSEWATRMLREAGGGEPDYVAALVEAGFKEADARHIVKLLESGRYFGLQDAVNHALGWNHHGMGVRYRHREPTPERIAAAEAKARGAAKACGVHGLRSLQERRTTAQVRPRIVESAVAASVGETLLSACLIDQGAGSSGYYPQSTLQEAARSKVFHAGLHCYVDHPTSSEEVERPVRSVKDLAGALEADAAYRDGGLWSTIRVYSSHRDFITERQGVIGLSIRADGEIGEASTNGQPTIARLVKAHSVDFVSAAGRGGRIAS